jgi:hypothetical protein
MGAIDHTTGDSSGPLRATCLQVSDILPGAKSRLKSGRSAVRPRP